MCFHNGLGDSEEPVIAFSPKKWLGRKVIDGDKSDLRHLEDGKKIIVGLIAKGRAIKNFNGG